jgi:lambda family phage minor tail protein L
MLSLSAVAKAEKNKMNTDSVFIILIELDVPLDGVDPIRICYNTEDITWNGVLWQAFPVEIGEITEDKSGSIPSFDIKVCNISQALTYYIEESNGANNGDLIIRVVNTKALDSTTPELEEEYRVTKVAVNEQWATMTVGTSYSPHSRRPLDRYIKNNCRYRTFKGVECGCTNASFTDCDRTLTSCRARGNSNRFGGFPGIDQGGVYV